MKQTHSSLHWDTELIPKAVAMGEKGSTLKEIAIALEVSYQSLLAHFRRKRNATSYVAYKAKARELRKKRVQALHQVEQESAQKKKAERYAKNHIECLVMRDKGMTLEEIGTELSFTRERARQILKDFGVTGRINKPSYYGVGSEEMLKKDASQKRKAFYLGLSIAEYENYIQVVPKDIRRTIKYRFRCGDRNIHNVKNLNGNTPLMQITAIELLSLYIQKAKELTPDCVDWSAVRTLLSPGSHYMVVRKDFSLPLSVTNYFFATRAEFGYLLGKTWKYGTVAIINT